MITTELDLMSAIDQVVKAGSRDHVQKLWVAGLCRVQDRQVRGQLSYFGTSRIIESKKQLNHQIIFSLRTLEQLIEQGTSGTGRLEEHPFTLSNSV
jgi:hypothetical protein